jgi:hypothetical protein
MTLSDALHVQNKGEATSPLPVHERGLRDAAAMQMISFGLALDRSRKHISPGFPPGPFLCRFSLIPAPSPPIAATTASVTTSTAGRWTCAPIGPIPDLTSGHQDGHQYPPSSSPIVVEVGHSFAPPGFL